MGGKPISESEIVIRKDTQYRIESAEYIRKTDNSIYPPSDYFEGTEYSWPNNPPPNCYPGKDVQGHWLIKLVEILR